MKKRVGDIKDSLVSGIMFVASFFTKYGIDVSNFTSGAIISILEWVRKSPPNDSDGKKDDSIAVA